MIQVRIRFFYKEDKNKRLTTVVPATRSARAIDGGEDGDGTGGTAKPRQILGKMELGGRAWRGESLSVARAFHQTPHVHRGREQGSTHLPHAGRPKTEGRGQAI